VCETRHRPLVLCFADQVLISGAADGNIALSHVSGSVLGTLAAPKSDTVDEITAVCLSSGSRYLCSGGTARRARVWDLKEKEMIKEFKSHTDTITCVQFNHSDVHVASGSLSGDVLIHSLLSAQTVATLRGTDAQPIRGLQYSPHHKTRLATVGDYGRVVVWETSERSVVAEFDSHHSAARGVAFSPINKLLLASAGVDKQLLFYDINDKKVIKSIDCEAPLTGVTFYEDGVTVAAGTTTGQLLVYDLRKGSLPIAKFEAHPGVEIAGVAFQRAKGSGKTSSRKTGEAGASATPSKTPAAKATPAVSEAKPTPLAPVAPLSTPKQAWAEPEASASKPAALEPEPSAQDEPSQSRAAETPQPERRVAETPPRQTPNPLYGRDGEPSPVVVARGKLGGLPAPQFASDDSASAMPRGRVPDVKIPDAAQVFQDMYARGPLEGDVGTVEWQSKFVKQALEDCFEGMRMQVHGDMQNMHLELVRQFQIQQTEIQAQLQGYAHKQHALVEEVEDLRAENRRLREQANNNNAILFKY